MSSQFHVKVQPLPAWLDWRRLLGPGGWSVAELPSGDLRAEADLDRHDAADLAARLRGVGIGGGLLALEIRPPLHRKELRRANTDEARRHRQRSPGFTHPSVQLDDEARFSLTPEALALSLGERARGQRVIDACGGAGGNAIGFARAGCRVLAIELDRQRLAMAEHNARVYGVAERIEFVCGDACAIVPERAADLLFIDPPWGERYDKARVTLEQLPPAAALIESSSHIPNRWLKVPPSFDPSSLPDCRAEAVFGAAHGDERRVKFLLVEASPA